MSKIVAGITTSVDGYVTGPDDGPGRGLGVGGERLHYWVFGGPWSYESARRGEASGEDKVRFCVPRAARPRPQTKRHGAGTALVASIPL